MRVRRARVSGQISGQEMWGSNTDLALYALYTPVLVVVIRADLVTPSSSFTDDDKACSELWFDPLVEAVKTRVVCVVLDRDHFQIGVVRTPKIRAVFRRGADWDDARRLILTFIKARTLGGPLGPTWTPNPSSSTSLLTLGSGSVPQASRKKESGVRKQVKLDHAHHTTQHARNTQITPVTTHA